MSVVGVQISKGVHEDDLVLGHWNLVLDVLWESLVGDHEDYDFEPLRAEVDQVKDRLVL